jgi:outer membrane immunogenic protein
MKKISLLAATAFASMVATSAFAADMAMPLKAPPMMAPSCVWCGWYVGGEVGAVRGRDRVNDLNGLNPPTSPYTLSDTAVIGSGELGYNWQIQQFVLGLEGNLGGMGLGATTIEPSSGGVTTSHIGSGLYGDVTGRLGLAAGNALFYAKGGYAFYEGKASVTNTGLLGGGTASTNAYTSGWTVGGGIEYMFVPSWSMKIEYQHFDFGSQTATLVTPAAGNFGYSNKLTADSLQAGLNYHFH